MIPTRSGDRMPGMKHLLMSLMTISSLTLLAACDCASCTVDTSKDAAAAPGATSTVITPASLSTEYSFSVKGMHCNGCANSLTQVINECDGVMTVAVSFDDSTAVVNVRDANALDCAIAGAKELGYETGTPEAVVWDTADDTDTAG